MLQMVVLPFESVDDISSATIHKKLINYSFEMCCLISGNFRAFVHYTAYMYVSSYA